MITILTAQLVSAIHISAGPHGIVAWIQPPHIAAGIGIIRGHIVAWWETA